MWRVAVSVRTVTTQLGRSTLTAAALTVPIADGRRRMMDLRTETVENPPARGDKQRLMPLAEYFALREKVSTQSLGAGLAVGVVSFFGSSQAVAVFAGDLLGNPYADPPIIPEPIWGMDPIIVFSMGTLSTTAIMFGLSRAVYRAIWGMTHKEDARRLEERKRDIFNRVEKFRCVGEEHGDDYYGESIKSAGTYLVWLRKQKQRTAELKALGLKEDKLI